MKSYLALLTLPLLLSLYTLRSQAQTGTIRGRIIDTISGTGVAYAVLQVSLDDSIRGGAMADSLGYYICEKVPRGNIVIEAQAMGYNPRKLQLQLNAARLELPPIYLSPSSTDIEEVRVTTQIPTVTLRPNRKEVTLPASEVAAGVPLDQLLLRTPGFTLNSQGVVEMTHGSFSILINGRPSGLTAAQLNTIDPSTIERIEVITAPSVEYRAGSQGGILNIITKGFKPGFNGTVQALGGFEGFFRGNLSGNVAWEKVNIFASIYGKYDFEPRSYVSRTTNPAGELIDEYLTNTRRRYYDIYPKIGVEYMPTPNVVLGTHYSYDYDVNRDNGTASISRPQTNLYLEGRRIWDVYKPSHRLHLFYSHAFPSIGAQLSMDFNGSYSTRKSEQSLDGTILSPWVRLVDPGDKNMGASGTITYKMLLPANFSLSTGVAGDYHNANRPQQRYNRLNDKTPWNLTSERSTAAEGGVAGIFAELGYQPIEKVTLNAGLRYEQFLRRIDANDNGTLNTINQNIGRLFGSGGISYNPNKWFSTSLSYASSVYRPDSEYYVMSEMIIDLVNMTGRGNPNLKFSYMDIVQLNFAEDIGDYYFSQDFSFRYSKDPITFGSRLENDSVWVSFIGNDRFDRTWASELYFYGKPTTWFSFWVSGNMNLYTRSDENGLLFAKNRFNGSIIGSVSFYFLKYFTISTRASYTSPYTFSTKQEKHKIYWDAYIYYRPLKTLSISLSMQNILNQSIQDYTTKNGDLTTHWQMNWFPRTIYINVYWRFGKDFRSKGGESLGNYETSRRHTSW